MQPKVECMRTLCDVAHPKPVAPAHGESAHCQVQPRVSRWIGYTDADSSGRGGRSRRTPTAVPSTWGASSARHAAPGWCARCRGGPGAPTTTRAEGFFGTLKCDFFEGRDWTGVPFDEFSRLLGEYIE